jgi:hypothetical protein
MRVTVRTLRGLPVDSQIVSMSGSGALVLSALHVPIGSIVLVEFRPAQTHSQFARTVRAEVIRPVRGGFAIEWQEFSVAPVRAVLRQIELETAPAELRLSQRHARLSARSD